MRQRKPAIVSERAQQSVERTRQRADLIAIITVNKTRFVAVTSMVRPNCRLTYEIMALRSKIAGNVWNTPGSIASDYRIPYIRCSTIVNPLAVFEATAAVGPISRNGGVRQRQSAANVINAAAASTV